MAYWDFAQRDCLWLAVGIGEGDELAAVFSRGKAGHWSRTPAVYVAMGLNQVFEFALLMLQCVDCTPVESKPLEEELNAFKSLSWQPGRVSDSPAF